MMTGERPLRRHSFILVLWAESGALPGSPPVWRASLEDTQSAQRYGFRDLAALHRFLERQTAVASAEPFEEK